MEPKQIIPIYVKVTLRAMAMKEYFRPSRCQELEPHQQIQLSIICSSEYLESVEYSSIILLPGPLWLEMVVPISVSSMSQIDLSKNYLYAKKDLLKINFTRNINLNIQWHSCGGPCGVMVIVVGIGHKFKSWTDCISHSTNTLGTGMNPIILPPAMGK